MSSAIPSRIPGLLWSPWKAVSAWLQRVPLADAMDRRNAATLQVLFLFLGTTVPLNWWRHWLADLVAPRERDFMIVDVTVTLLCFAWFWMLRRGLLHSAIGLFLGTQLLSACVGYATGSVMFDQTTQMLVLVIAGLVLGRRALWSVFLMLLGVSAIGVLARLMPETQTAEAMTRAAVMMPSFVMNYLVITVVLDRCIAALREALAESRARGARLEQEMRERERAQAQLIEAQKLEATGRLASGIAHDFDNILGLMAAFSSERHRIDPGASHAERADALDAALEGVELSAQRGMSLTRQLLTFARPDVARPERFDAGAAITELVPMLRQMFGPDIRLHIERGAQSAWILIDRSQFDLMVLNIAANARDAMPTGGRFDLGLRIEADTVLELTLRDSGHGMPDSVRARIFEPFFSTKPADRGTGLGLSVTHTLVTGARGSIHADSTPGQGTTFVIRLPLASGAPAQPPAPQPSEVSA